MKAVGIVAEYNPFHLGHAWHIAETRRQLGEDVPAVCVMSGDWVQRGECALTDKWTRAKLALRGGADLVLELPVPWSISSAEGFALGALALLEAAGVVDILSFGSECGDADLLERAAAGLDSPGCQAKLRRLMGEGLPFPAARQAALQSCWGPGAEVLSSPNNNLGVEYIRALNALRSGIRPMTVPRKGEGHDGAPGEEMGGPILSASTIRSRVRQGRWEEAAGALPAGAAEILRRAGIADMRRVERAVLARLRRMDAEDFAALPDSGAGEGLPARLVRAAGQAASLEEFYSLAKSKRYTHARIRRLAVWAFLGISGADRPDAPRYLRVLGMNSRGMALLREMKKTAALPVLTKPAHVKELGEEARRQFALSCRATDLYGLCFDRIKPGGLDYTTGPVIV